MSGPERRTHFRADLRAMLGDGIAFSFMVGTGESYLAAFALAIGLGDVTAGMVATAPMLLGALLQLVTPAAVGWLGSHKRWVVLCASLQAMSFVPLIAAALAGGMSTLLLYLTVGLYWGLGLATGPAWNTWAGRLVPARIQAPYFAHRARWCQAALAMGLAIGGLVLQLGERRGQVLDAYAFVFGVALLARAISALFLGRQSEIRPVPLGESRISLGAIRDHMHSGGHGRLLAHLLVFQSSVWIAAPYFTPYMLGPLGLDYLWFTALTGSAFLARIFALPALGRLAHRSGTRLLLRLACFGITPLPALWLVSDTLPWLFALQIFGGVAWAAFELATLLSFFEHIPLHARTSVLSIYNLAYALAIAIGTLVGAVILQLGSGDARPYALLLLFSTLARLASLRMLRGLPDVVPPGTKPPPLRTLGLRPSAGALQHPVLAAMPQEEDPEDSDWQDVG